ncbi:Uncharacterized protein OBRU01_06375, partial [Operophtera brumata]
MNLCLVFVLFGYFFAWTSAMLYRRDDDNVLKPDLLAISSTVVPLPALAVYRYEKKILQEKNKKPTSGKLSL